VNTRRTSFASCRRATGVAILLAACAQVVAGQQQPFVERVDVSRVLIDARVLDDRWRPVPGLGPSDFLVEIDGEPVRVESVEWVERGTAGEQSSGTPGDRAARSPARLIVVLVQKDLEPLRIVGLMRMLRIIEPLLEQLTPDDRVAVLSFDSHLKIWTDFTGDFDRVRSLLHEDLLLRRPPPVSAGQGPSLLSRLDQASSKRIHGFEDSLRAIGDALEPLPGAKSIVLLGHGFGRFDPSTQGAVLLDRYGEAREALLRARAAVFALNVTQANYNSLQIGLQAVAAATGGFYASTYEFPTLAMERVVHALEGYYVLFVDKPAGKAGGHRIQVRLADRHGTVFARSRYVD
jgi:VWFA-related protein